MFHTIKNSHGFVRLVLIIIVAILVLSYFGFNIQSIVESPATQKNLSYVKSLVVHVWVDYLKSPVMYLYQDIWLKYIWSAFIKALDTIKSGGTPAEMVTGAEFLPSAGTSTGQ